LRDITGKAWSPKTIARAKFEAYSVAQPHDQQADKLMQSRKAFVLDVNCAYMFNCKVEELFIKYKYDNMPVYADLESLTSGMHSTGQIVDKKNWLASEHAWCKVIDKMQYLILKYSYNHFNFKTRRIVVGVSDVADAWTDGETFIAFNKSLLSNYKMFVRGRISIRAITKIALILIHELCHDTDSRANVHSPDFYREYHDWTHHCIGNVIHGIAEDVTPAKYKAMAVRAGASNEETIEYLQNEDVE